MELTLEDEGEDFATLTFRPGPDDSFNISGYATRNSIRIEIPLYSHEAQELIDILTPLARQTART